LRQDDGLGWHVAEQLALDFARQANLQVEVCHQLTPELAEPISRAERVLFIDADIRLVPGALELTPLTPGRPVLQPSTHHVDAGWLLTLAERLFGRRPAEAVMLHLGPAGVDHGETLTPLGEGTRLAALAAATRWIDAGRGTEDG
jgi:hydrogenase maturation protease